MHLVVRNNITGIGNESNQHDLHGVHKKKKNEIHNCIMSFVSPYPTDLSRDKETSRNSTKESEETIHGHVDKEE
jgi:hypothetical protein